MGLRLKMLVGSPLKGKYSVNQLNGVEEVEFELEEVRGAGVEVVVCSSTTLCLLITSAFTGFPLERKLMSGLTMSDFIGVLVLTRILLFCLLYPGVSSFSFSSSFSVLTRCGKRSGSVLYWASWDTAEMDLAGHGGGSRRRENRRTGYLQVLYIYSYSNILNINQIF